MMVNRKTPILKMTEWLMPDTAAYLDQQTMQVQWDTLSALREWMCKREDDLEDVDLFDIYGMVDQFVRAFVNAYRRIK